MSVFVFSSNICNIHIFKKNCPDWKRKKKNQLKYENIYFVGDKIIEDIRNREFGKFLYKGNQDNIHISQNIILFRKDGKFYKLEYKKGKLYISDGDNAEKLGAETVIGQYDNVEFKKIDNLLIIILKYKKENEIRVLNLFWFFGRHR